jgi:hypothetical protein
VCSFLPVRSLLIATISPVCGKYISVLKETTKRSENDQIPDVILSRAGPELELKAEQRNNETPSSTLDKDIAVFKRVSFTLKAGSSQATAGERTMPGSNDKERERERSRPNEYFVPKDGIDREVITADICCYLGNEALVRPGNYEVYIANSLDNGNILKLPFRTPKPDKFSRDILSQLTAISQP